MVLPVLLLIGGLILLIWGANSLIDAASALARNFNVSELAIGLTVIAFGTSMPELVVNVFATIKDQPDLVFGNVIGSNIFNLLLILGLAGMILPMHVQSTTVWKEIPISFLAAVFLLLIVNISVGESGLVLNRLGGSIFLLLFAAFIYYVFKELPKAEASQKATMAKAPLKHIFGIVAGLAGLIIGGQLIVTNASEIASGFGMSEKMIGTTIVATGTSLPEFAATLIAARKKNIDLAVGNIIGSNIFNILFILGVSSLVRPLTYNSAFDLPVIVLIAGTVFLFIAMFTGTKGRLDRWEAAILFIGFIAYFTYLIKGSF